MCRTVGVDHGTFRSRCPTHGAESGSAALRLSRRTAVSKARKLGYYLNDDGRHVLKFYRAKAS